MNLNYVGQGVLKFDREIRKWRGRQIKPIDRCYLDLVVTRLHCSNCLSDSATNCASL